MRLALVQSRISCEHFCHNGTQLTDRVLSAGDELTLKKKEATHALR
jgi:hypothetical protein